MSNEYLHETQQILAGRFDGEAGTFRGDLRLTITPAQIVAAATALREEFGFELLSDITAVDYWPQPEPRFHLVYQFSSVQHNCRLEVRVPVSGEEPAVSTISDVYWNANWYEREIYDLMGIRFEGHPDLRRILMPDDWEGHPLRKDYPLGYEEVQFTFNEEEIMARKLHPKE
ncbi:MAG: NADH-quinone oxidoreductase subunit C [Anaerolineales bacterium]